MNRPINQDIENYKDDFWKGLTLRECLYGGIAVLAGSGIIGGAYYFWGIPIAAAVYLAIPVVVPIGLNGFWKSKNGMALMDYAIQLLKVKYSEPYVYRSGEKEYFFGSDSLDNYVPIKADFLPEDTGEREMNNEKK